MRHAIISSCRTHAPSARRQTIATTAHKMNRVLVVEDYPDAREFLTTVFEDAGYEVLTAGDGAEGVAVAQASRPAVIVMDIFMPVMDGVEATRRIKSTPGLEQVPVIAYTARSSWLDHKELFAAVCIKPCPPDVLLEVVAQAASGKPISGQVSVRKPWH